MTSFLNDRIAFIGDIGQNNYNISRCGLDEGIGGKSWFLTHFSPH